MGLREQSIVGCFPEFVFQLSVAHVLVGLRKQFMFFPLGPVLLVLIIIITIWHQLTRYRVLYGLTIWHRLTGQTGLYGIGR